MELPLVSIVMPVFNCERTILGALNSVCAQTYRNWELLIQDDGSTDGTAKLLSNVLQRDSRITYRRSKSNNGASAARNCAIAHARGAYICFLDADDYWLPHKIEKQLAFMEAERCHISATLSFRENQNEIYFLSCPVAVRRKDLLKDNPVHFLSVMYRKREFGHVRFQTLRSRNDLMFLLDCLKDDSVLYVLQQPLCVYRATTGSLSANRLKNVSDHWKCLNLAGVRKCLIPFFIISVTAHSIIKRRFPKLYNHRILKA